MRRPILILLAIAAIAVIALTLARQDGGGGRAVVQRRAVSAGMRVRIGDATFAILAPAGDPCVDVPSHVLRLERGSFSMFFMGHATEQAQADLLLTPQLLAARVCVPPHHCAAGMYAGQL